MRTRASDEQFSLPGIGDPTPVDNLFFAIFPDTDGSERITDLARTMGVRHRLRGKPLLKERFHTTLHKLGVYDGVPQDLVRDASRAAGELDEPAFDVVFDRAGSFIGEAKKPYVLLGPEDGSPLHQFHRALHERLAIHGVKTSKSGFTPHVTLLYDLASVPIQAVPPIAWTVREFVLVHSLVGKTEHRILGRWPLRG